MAEIRTIDVTDYPTEYGDKDHILVDVREVDEYEDGHIPGAINLPLSEFQEIYEDIPTDKTVVLVCQRGGRSAMAADFLLASGDYEDIVNLDGGTSGWISAGNDVETD